MLSPTALDYLEAIYNLTLEGDAVVNARLAEKFGVSAPSVTEMLHRLERDGYVVLDRATGPRLTETGVEAAEATLRRHRLAERFLLDVLKLDWIAAHEEAHALQNALTPAIEAGMVALLGGPTTCPHGNPIPGSAPGTRDFLRAHRAFRLSGAPPDTPLEVLCISEVVEDETALLRAVGEIGIRPGVAVVLRQHAPTAWGRLGLIVDGREVDLSRAIADKIWVILPAPPSPF
jgi:DtxR family Mn-dependent transcriptional regulator